MSPGVAESVEAAAIASLQGTGWHVARRPRTAARTAADATGTDSAVFGELVLTRRLYDTLCRLNPELPTGAIEDPYRRLTRNEGADLVHWNRVRDPDRYIGETV